MESTLKKRNEMYSIVQKISSVNQIDVTLYQSNRKESLCKGSS